MSVNILQSISNHRNRHSQFFKNGDTQRVRLFRKKSIILKRTPSIAKLSKDPLIKNKEIESPIYIHKNYTENLKKYSDMCQDVIQDIQYSNKNHQNGFVLSKNKLNSKDIIRQKTKQQINRNSQILKQRLAYTRNYNTKFQDSKDVDEERKNWKEWKSYRHSIETTTVTHSTIQKTENVKLPKTALLSILENKAKQFDARYSNVLDLPKQIVDEQQVFIERKKSHFAYVRHRQTKSSMSNHPSININTNLKTINNNNNNLIIKTNPINNSNNINNLNSQFETKAYHSGSYKVNPQLRMIERYIKQQTDYTRSLQKQRNIKKQKERIRIEKEKKRQKQIEEFRDKVFISKSHLRQCAFPFEASRCHSLKKTAHNILLLQQL